MMPSAWSSPIRRGDLGVEARARPVRGRSRREELADPLHLVAHVGQRGGGFLMGPVAHPKDHRCARRPPLRFPPMTRVGFLGPHGTFAEEALLTQPDLAAGEAVAVPRRART